MRRAAPGRGTRRRLAAAIGAALASLAPFAAAHGAACARVRLDVALEGARGLRPVVAATLNGRRAALIFDTGGTSSYIASRSADAFGLRRTGAVATFRSFGQEVSAPVAHADALSVGDEPAAPADFLVVGNDPRFDGALGWPQFREAAVLLDLPAGRIDLQPTDAACGTARWPAWVSDPAVAVIDLEPGEARPIGRVRVDGVELRALFDTGSPDTSLTENAAERAGVTASSPGAESVGVSGGLGAGGLPTWSAVFGSLKVGRETMSDVRLLFMRKPDASADMILGADFFRTHRVLISMRDRRLYVLPVQRGGFLRRRPDVDGGAAALTPSPR